MGSHSTQKSENLGESSSNKKQLLYLLFTIFLNDRKKWFIERVHFRLFKSIVETKHCLTPYGCYRFLNEMIKLVSPRYLGDRTPHHIKRKTIELLYVWTRELPTEPKIREAYDMVKAQGLVHDDPATYVGDAVFAAALPPRRGPEPLDETQSRELRRLLQSKNPEDLEQANKIIKGMVREDERKLDALTRRSAELGAADNSAKLLGEMLDNYEGGNSGPEELELLAELFQSCQKMQPKLFRLAAETDDSDDGGLGEILRASDEVCRVVDRYRELVQHRPVDTVQKAAKDAQKQLLDVAVTAKNPESTSGRRKASSERLLDVGIADNPEDESVAALDDDILGLGELHKSLPKEVEAPPLSLVTAAPAPPSSLPPESVKKKTSVDDLLNGSPVLETTSALAFVPTTSEKPNKFETQMEEQKSSRRRGLDELDALGESAIKSHLSSRSPQFAKKDKVPMNKMKQPQSATTLNLTQSLLSSRQPKPGGLVQVMELPKEVVSSSEPKMSASQKPSESEEICTKEAAVVRLADLHVDLSSIQPSSSLSPLTLNEENDSGIVLILNFCRDEPRQHVKAVVVTILNKSSHPVSDLELKALVHPKGCKVKLQEASGRSLPAFSPFAPPAAITQVMLVARDPKLDSSTRLSLKYVLSYTQDGEAQTEMGQAKELPI